MSSKISTLPLSVTKKLPSNVTHWLLHINREMREAAYVDYHMKVLRNAVPQRIEYVDQNDEVVAVVFGNTLNSEVVQLLIENKRFALLSEPLDLGRLRTDSSLQSVAVAVEKDWHLFASRNWARHVIT